MSDAIVEIVPYDQEWPGRFRQERDRLIESLGPWLVGSPEHIGSTAVPGMCAKPVIDIMAPVRSLVESEGAISRAALLGYLHYPYKPEVMHWFCKPSTELRTHHLHLVPDGSQQWRDRLAFRDALRSSSELRAEYRDLKERLARVHRWDREAYTEEKSPFVQRVLLSVLSGGRSAA